MCFRFQLATQPSTHPRAMRKACAVSSTCKPTRVGSDGVPAQAHVLGRITRKSPWRLTLDLLTSRKRVYPYDLLSTKWCEQQRR